MLGMVKVTALSDQLFTVPAVAPTSTEPVVEPKPLPATVTVIPGCPTVGPIDPTSGAEAVLVNCHTATACAGSVNVETGLLPPVPLFTVMLEPPSSAARLPHRLTGGSAGFNPRIEY